MTDREIKEKEILLQVLRKFSLPPTAEQLCEIVFGCFDADPLSQDGFHHRGSPFRIDGNGHTKEVFFDAAINRDTAFFEPIVRVLRRDSTWLSLMLSQRTWELKEGTASYRPIDIPSIAKHLYAVWIRVALRVLVPECGALDERVIGFRKIIEFEQFAKRNDGCTIQDVFASTVRTLLQRHGLFALSIDLADAYGNLPHAAIHQALKELGLDRIHRRRIVELVRIRAIADGRLLKPRGFGIEQGNPLSPDIFNLVISMIFRKMRKAGYEAASFGDDIVVAATTDDDAKQAFEVFKSILTDLGFDPEKVRPIGEGEKATHIYDTTTTPVPLIRTYLVGRGEIGLQQSKVDALLSELRKLPPVDRTLSELRRLNKWKAVSKSFLRSLLPRGESIKSSGRRRPEVTSSEGPAPDGGGPPLVSRGPEGSVGPLSADQDTRVASIGDVSPGEAHGDLDGSARKGDGHSPPHGYGSDAHGDHGSNVYGHHGNGSYGSGATTPTGPAGVKRASTVDGRRVPSRGASGAGVTLSQGVGGVGHSPPTPLPVIVSLTAGDIDTLRDRYTDVYLLRNQKLFQLYRFADGRPFEPDFVLFLTEKATGKTLNYQLFIEPKGQHLIKHDDWKEGLLKQIEDEHRIT